MEGIENTEKKLYWIYILKCWRNSNDWENYGYYTGYTGRDPFVRFKEHLRGRCKYTRQFELLELVYFEKVSTSKDYALRREKFIKELSNKKKSELIKSMPRPKGTSSIRNKRYDKDEVVTCKITQFQNKYLKTKDNKSEHIRNLINFSMWLETRGRNLFSRLFILCNNLLDEQGSSKSEISVELNEILHKIAKKIRYL